MCTTTSVQQYTGTHSVPYTTETKIKYPTKKNREKCLSGNKSSYDSQTNFKTETKCEIE